MRRQEKAETAKSTSTSSTTTFVSQQPGAFRIQGVDAPENEVHDVHDDENHPLHADPTLTITPVHAVVCEPDDEVFHQVRERILQEEVVVAHVHQVGNGSADDSSKSSQRQKQTNKKKRWWIAAVILVLLVMAIVVGVVVGLQQTKSSSKDKKEANSAPSPSPSMPSTNPFRTEVREFLLDRLSVPFEANLESGSSDAFEDLLQLLDDGQPLNDTVYDMFTLLTLFYNGGGATWVNSTGWRTAPDMCSWYGVTCHENGTLSELRLSNNNITGSTTVVFPRFAEYVTAIDFSSNSIFQSAFIATGSKFSHLEYLNLSHNGFDVDVAFLDLPSGYAERLVILDLSDNGLYGTLPSFLGPAASLEVLHLNDNPLVGGDLNRFVEALPSLRETHLGNTAVTGSVTSELCSLLSNLTTFVVDCSNVECRSGCCDCT